MAYLWAFSAHSKSRKIINNRYKAVNSCKNRVTKKSRYTFKCNGFFLFIYVMQLPVPM